MIRPHIVSPVLEMRKMPDSHSEVVSQAVFSEQIQILEEQEEWLKIRTLIDQYDGWVKKEGICSQNHPFFFQKDSTTLTINRLAAHLFYCPDTMYGPMLTLPFESQLTAIDFKNDDSRWINVLLPDSRKAFIQRGDVSITLPKMKAKEICQFSFSFLGLPYTWGGRSSFGYDCSGFVQMLYRQMGILLPRDSKDQFTFPGLKDSSIEALTPADLLFFGFSEKQIRHVGLFLGEGKFIHNCAVTENRPYIRISDLADSAWNGSGYYPFVAGRKK